ncbi:MAG: hypothetical protein BYD32DRAFT_422709 [Podila humilis]|nr:MAG: hypothetical protein BYD32DRAFT_422709 [Podila humilis]
MTMAASVSKYTVFALVALIATALFTLPVSAGHDCWTFDSTECNRFCRDELHRGGGQCAGFFNQECQCWG